MTADPDGDLDLMDRDALVAIARATRAAIHEHRDATGHALRWHHPDMRALLPDPPKGGQVVPEWSQFMRGCVSYRASLDERLADAPQADKEYEG